MKKLTDIKYVWTLVLLAVGLVSCDDGIDYGRTSEISSNAVVQKVLVLNGEEGYVEPDNEVRVRLGSQLRLEGNNLDGVTSLFFNGKEVLPENFVASAKTYIETVVPDDTPIGYAAGELRDTLYLKAPTNEFGMPLTIISKVFDVAAVAMFNDDGTTVGSVVTLAGLGDKIQLQGAELDYVTEVYVNGLAVADFAKTPTAIDFTIPDETPVGSRAGEDADKIRLVNEFGETLEYDFTIVGHQPTASDEEIAPVKKGETVTLAGAYLGAASEISLKVGDGEAVSVNVTPNAEGTQLTFVVPANVASGNATATLSLTGLEPVTWTFAVWGESPVVDRVSHTLAKAGERIRIYGSNFENVRKVVFPGDVEAAVPVGGEAELDAKGELWVHSEEGYDMIDIIIPDGGDQTAGALYVEAEEGNGGYSCPYMNCNDNVFIDSYASGTAYFSANTRLAVDQSETVGISGSLWPESPSLYAAYPADGTENTSALDSNNSGVYRFKPQVALADLVSSIGRVDCGDLAFQFDCWITNSNDFQWTSGVIRFGFNLPNGSNGECHILPWHKEYEDKYKEADMDFSTGWKTVTVPLGDLVTMPRGTTFGEAVNSLNSENPGGMIVVFGNIPLMPDGGARDEGEDMNDFRIYFGNFRIVPYAKPQAE